MNSDIRLQATFFTHPKIMRLRRELGADAVLSLLALWVYTAQNRPHGELRGMDGIDIEMAAQWAGDQGAFVAAATRLRLLDKKGCLYVVHDWQEHNPWAFHAPERKARAKKAAEAKWAKQNKKDVCDEHEEALLDDAKGKPPAPKKKPSKDADLLFDEFWQAYPRKTAKPNARKAWDKLGVDALLSARMVQAIETQRRGDQWQRDGGQFIPHPATWLNQRRWEDEIEVVSGGRSDNQFAGVR